MSEGPRWDSPDDFYGASPYNSCEGDAPCGDRENCERCGWDD